MVTGLAGAGCSFDGSQKERKGRKRRDRRQAIPFKSLTPTLIVTYFL